MANRANALPIDASRLTGASAPSTPTTRFVTGRVVLGLTLLAAWLAIALALTGKAHAGPAYDGAWHVTIITESGNCDKAYSYPVKVAGGQISYAGDGSFDISGKVGDAGIVSVAIARGDQKASASGKLSASSGSGQWTGKSSSMNCAGRWEASRS